MKQKVETIIDPDEIKRILIDNSRCTDIDQYIDTDDASDDLAEYLDKWITEDRANQESNAVQALKKITKYLNLMIGNTSYCKDVKLIIKDTYGAL